MAEEQQEGAGEGGGCGISWLGDRVGATINRCFFSYGTFAAKRPWLSILISVAFVVACCPGLFFLRFDNDEANFYLDGSLTKLASLANREAFPFNPAENSVFVYFFAKEGKNLLAPQALADMGRAIDGVMAVKTPDGKAFAQLCEKSWRGSCEATSFLHVFRDQASNLGYTVTPPASGEGEMESLAKQFGTWCGSRPTECGLLMKPLYGFITVPADKGGAGALNLKSVMFILHPDPSVKDASGAKSSDAFQVAVMEHIHAPAYAAQKDNLQTDDFFAINVSQAAISAEGARPAGAEGHLMAIAFIIIVVFVCCSIYAPTKPRNRNVLAMSVMMVVLLSLVCAVGLSAYCQVPLTSMTTLVVFTLFGVSVDDIIVIVHTYDRLEERSTVEDVDKRIATSLANSGAAITLTSMTSLVAFFVAAICPIKNISFFCITSALGILAVYVLQITLFLPLMVLDERRRLSGRRSCGLTRCFGTQAAAGESAFDTPPPKVVQVLTSPAVGGGCGLVTGFARHVAFSAPARAAVAVCFVGFTALGVWGSANADSEADLTDYYMDTSFMKEYFRLHRSLWEAKSPLDLVITHGGEGMPSEGRRAEVDALFDDLSALPFTFEPREHWLREFDIWLNATHATATDLQASRLACTADAYTFGSKVVAFLDATPFTGPSGKLIMPWEHKRNVVVKDGLVQTFRLVMRYETDFTKQARYVSNWRAVYDLMHPPGSSQEFMRGRVPNTYVHTGILAAAERDAKIKGVIFYNLGQSCAAVAVTVMIMLHPLIGIFVGALVLCLDAMVLGLLTLYGAKLDFVAFLCLSMTIGLVVDYATHTCHAYVHHKGSLDEKLFHAMGNMGSSVLSGGASTVLGISVLAFAGSKAFRTFFYVLGTAVTIGTLVGIAISPVLLRSLHGAGLAAKEFLAGCNRVKEFAL